MSSKSSRTIDPLDPPTGGTEGNTGQAPISVEATMTEQEKGGPDPVSDPVEPGPLVEPVGVAPREPYPTGSPQDPEDAFQAAHGYRRAKA